MATMVDAPAHVPVQLARVVELLAQAPAGLIIDATVGAGGHAVAVARARKDRFGQAPVLGFDRDPDAAARAQAHLDAEGVDADVVNAGFETFEDALEQRGAERVAGMLFDLGVSSMQLDQDDRGFSYRRDAPLDMRMDPAPGIASAADIVNRDDVADIARILREFGEERFARRIADAIVRARPITRTVELAEIVKNAIPAAARRTGGHPATRTFQALRIAVNGELAVLDDVLPRAIARLDVGGVLVVISYHSLEDRCVKRAFADAARGCVCPPRLPVCGCGRRQLVEYLVRRPQRPDPDEVAANPRARSALLRAVRRIDGDDQPAPERADEPGRP